MPRVHQTNTTTTLTTAQQNALQTLHNTQLCNGCNKFKSEFSNFSCGHFFCRSCQRNADESCPVCGTHEFRAAKTGFLSSRLVTTFGFCNLNDGDTLVRQRQQERARDPFDYHSQSQESLSQQQLLADRKISSQKQESFESTSVDDVHSNGKNRQDDNIFDAGYSTPAQMSCKEEDDSTTVGPDILPLSGDIDGRSNGEDAKSCDSGIVDEKFSCYERESEIVQGTLDSYNGSPSILSPGSVLQTRDRVEQSPESNIYRNDNEEDKRIETRNFETDCSNHCALGDGGSLAKINYNHGDIGAADVNRHDEAEDINSEMLNLTQSQANKQSGADEIRNRIESESESDETQCIIEHEVKDPNGSWASIDHHGSSVRDGSETQSIIETVAKEYTSDLDDSCSVKKTQQREGESSEEVQSTFRYPNNDHIIDRVRSRINVNYDSTPSDEESDEASLSSASECVEGTMKSDIVDESSFKYNHDQTSSVDLQRTIPPPPNLTLEHTEEDEYHAKDQARSSFAFPHLSIGEDTQMPDEIDTNEQHLPQRSTIPPPPQLSLEYTEMEKTQSMEPKKIQLKSPQQLPTLSLEDTESGSGSQVFDGRIQQREKNKKDLSSNSLSKAYDSLEELKIPKPFNQTATNFTDAIDVGRRELALSNDSESNSKRMKKKSRNNIPKRKPGRFNRDQLLIVADIDMLSKNSLELFMDLEERGDCIVSRNVCRVGGTCSSHFVTTHRTMTHPFVSFHHLSSVSPLP